MGIVYFRAKKPANPDTYKRAEIVQPSIRDYERIKVAISRSESWLGRYADQLRYIDLEYKLEVIDGNKRVTANLLPKSSNSNNLPEFLPQNLPSLLFLYSRKLTQEFHMANDSKIHGNSHLLEWLVHQDI